jgi:hypothetical protein
MARVRATCAACGDVELGTCELQVQVCSGVAGGTYSFVCPRCHLIVNKPAEMRTIDLLVSAGVKLVRLAFPAELSEPKSGPPIAYDDLLAFHFELDGSTLEHLLGGPGGSR